MISRIKNQSRICSFYEKIFTLEMLCKVWSIKVTNPGQMKNLLRTEYLRLSKQKLSWKISRKYKPCLTCNLLCMAVSELVRTGSVLGQPRLKFRKTLIVVFYWSLDMIWRQSLIYKYKSNCSALIDVILFYTNRILGPSRSKFGLSSCHSIMKTVLSSLTTFFIRWMSNFTKF